MQFEFEVYDSTIESTYQRTKIKAIVEDKKSFTSLASVSKTVPFRLGIAETNALLLRAINQEVEERSLPKRFLERRNLMLGEEARLEEGLTPPFSYRRVDTTQRASIITVEWRNQQSLDQLETARRLLVEQTLNKENADFLTLLNSNQQNVIKFKTETDQYLSLDEIGRVVDTALLRISGYRFEPNVLLFHPEVISEYASSVAGIRVVTDISIPRNKVYCLARPAQLGIFWERSPLMIESSMNPNIFGTNLAIWQDSAMHIINQNSIQTFQLAKE